MTRDLRYLSTWTIDWEIANFGSHPAQNVLAMADFYVTDDESIRKVAGPIAAEFFPDTEARRFTTRVPISNEKLALLSDHENRLVAEFTIEYIDSTGRRYKHSAEARF
jgi:hypothetical protein